MTFPTMYSEHFRSISPSGDFTEPDYRQMPGEDGELTLVEVGRKPTYEMIQAAAEGSALQSILPEILAGHKSLDDVTVDVSQFGDITKAPQSLLDAQNMLVNASNQFEALPLEVRSEYKHDFRQWLAAVDSGDFDKRFLSPERDKRAAADAAAAAERQKQADEEEKRLFSRFKEFLTGGNKQ